MFIGVIIMQNKLRKHKPKKNQMPWRIKWPLAYVDFYRSCLRNNKLQWGLQKKKYKKDTDKAHQ
jgi:hypothetical protein